MSIVNLNAENVIYDIVEAMLPRFSDDKLGLLIGIDIHIADHGYAKDGNTRERKAKSVRERYYFLFVRPSNYTKVFLWEPEDDETRFFSTFSKGYWKLLSNHDSCWRDAYNSELTDFYFNVLSKFDGRIKSGKIMTPDDLFEFITLVSMPEYMIIEGEQRDKKAGRFSSRGRVWDIKVQPTTFAKLEMIESPNTKEMSNSGLLIKGSKTHDIYVKNIERIANKV